MAKSRKELRDARHSRLRGKIVGTAQRPRLAVYRSLKHIYVQLIDDSSSATLASASTEEKDFKGSGNVEGAKKVGAAIAQRAKEKGINQVVFDRGGFSYHGRVAALADGARESGLEF